MDSCTFHPNHLSVERCEVCQRPLCGQCLWYTEKGHRYCEEHATDAQREGLHIFSPETYASAVENSLRVKKAGSGRADAIPYKGNKNDLNAFWAAGIGIITISSCFGGIYCLPFVGLVLGIMAYNKADQSVDPQRTRTLAGIGIGVGALIILAIVALIVVYVAIFGFALTTSFSP